jgi:hypothetical protein
MGSETSAPSKKLFWTGWVVSALPIPMLLMSAAMKVTAGPQAMEGFSHLGWEPSLAIPLAITEIACVAIYLIPRTAVLGAILLTGYLGGAIATHVRVQEVDFIFPLLLGVVAWLGLYMRDARLRKLLPWRT